MFDAFDYELEEMTVDFETAEETEPEIDNPESEECEIEKKCADFREVGAEFLSEEKKYEMEADGNSCDFEGKFFQNIHRISKLSKRSFF